MSKVAIIQKPPVLFDRDKTIQSAVALINEAVNGGAEMVIFTEAFIPGYPIWIWRLRPGGDFERNEELHSLLLDNAVDLEQQHLLPLYDAAKQHNVTIVCGVDERDGNHSRGTLYNTIVIIGPDGTLLNRHRKLMPSNPERMVWGFGDASGLNVIETPCGRIGAMPCWENYMPLARYTLYSQGVEIYIAPTYDSGDNWIGTLKHIAREGCCWVVGCGNVLQGSDIPYTFPGKSEIYPDPDEWINAGDSIVIDPKGEVTAGPMRKEKGILYAEIDASQVGIARRSFDVVGHYARPDIFQLQVNRQRQKPIKFV
jgi:nitrilase